MVVQNGYRPGSRALRTSSYLDYAALIFEGLDMSVLQVFDTSKPLKYYPLAHYRFLQNKFLSLDCTNHTYYFGKYDDIYDMYIIYERNSGTDCNCGSCLSEVHGLIKDEIIMKAFEQYSLFKEDAY
jgi:hypothetical protein